MSPHVISVQFHKKTRMSAVAFYVDFKLDESYTPMDVAIRAGTAAHDLREVTAVALDEPVGWVVIPLTGKSAADAKADGTGAGAGAEGGVLRANLLQMVVRASHQNGRDTHIRQIKLFGPRAPPSEAKGLASDTVAVAPDPAPHFSTLAFQQFATLR
jgi:anaphase-promoting complex subunit 10